MSDLDNFLQIKTKFDEFLHNYQGNKEFPSFLKNDILELIKKSTKIMIDNHDNDEIKVLFKKIEDGLNDEGKHSDLLLISIDFNKKVEILKQRDEKIKEQNEKIKKLIKNNGFEKQIDNYMMLVSFINRKVLGKNFKKNFDEKRFLKYYGSGFVRNNYFIMLNKHVNLDNNDVQSVYRVCMLSVIKGLEDGFNNVIQESKNIKKFVFLYFNKIEGILKEDNFDEFVKQLHDITFNLKKLENLVKKNVNFHSNRLKLRVSLFSLLLLMTISGAVSGCKDINADQLDTDLIGEIIIENSKVKSKAEPINEEINGEKSLKKIFSEKKMLKLLKDKYKIYLNNNNLHVGFSNFPLQEIGNAHGTIFDFSLIQPKDFESLDKPFKFLVSFKIKFTNGIDGLFNVNYFQTKTDLIYYIKIVYGKKYLILICGQNKGEKFAFITLEEYVFSKNIDIFESVKSLQPIEEITESKESKIEAKNHDDNDNLQVVNNDDFKNELDKNVKLAYDMYENPDDYDTDEYRKVIDSIINGFDDKDIIKTHVSFALGAAGKNKYVGEDLYNQFLDDKKYDFLFENFVFNSTRTHLNSFSDSFIGDLLDNPLMTEKIFGNFLRQYKLHSLDIFMIILNHRCMNKENFKIFLSTFDRTINHNSNFSGIKQLVGDMKRKYGLN